jgi:hypothetical protein
MEQLHEGHTGSCEEWPPLVSPHKLLYELHDLSNVVIKCARLLVFSRHE